MMKNQLSLILISFGLLIVSKPATAFPVLDFGQVIPLPQQVSNGIARLKEVKDSLTNLKQTLSEIGDEVKSISEFSKDISIDPSKLKKAAKVSHNNVLENMEGIAVAQSGLSDILKMAQEAKQDLAEGIVAQTEELLVASEENPQIKENLAANFESTKEIGVQLAENVNESFNTALNTLNKNAEKSYKSLVELNKVVKNEKTFDATEINTLLARDLDNRERAASDMGINIIEKAHAQYNKEYKENFADELNNYQKIVLAYANGNVNKEDVVNAGQQFKLAVANITTHLNDSDIANYQKEAQTIKNEMGEVTTGIIKHFDEGDNIRHI